MSAPTTVDVFTPEQWAQRLLALFPQEWTNDSARMAGGILHSWFQSTGGEYEFLENGLEWLLAACRISTARGGALDAFAKDYFGYHEAYVPSVVRQPGEPDEAFRKRIYTHLLAPGGRRADISRVVELLTGQRPRIIEPWSSFDIACCDKNSFCDVDTAQNPSVVGNTGGPVELGGMPHQGFVMSILPPYGENSKNPVYCVDAGLACDRSFIIDPKATWFLGEKQLDMALNRTKMFGTIIWRSYGESATVDYLRGGNHYLYEGVTGLSLNLSPRSSQALSILASSSWNATVSAKAVGKSGFTLLFSGEAPPDQVVDWIAAPVTTPGYGLLYLAAGVEEISLSAPATDMLTLITPSWNTSAWVTSHSEGVISFRFSVPAPPGAFLNYGAFRGSNKGKVEVPGGGHDQTITFDASIENPYQLIILPGWNTSFSVERRAIGFTVHFGTPAPEEGGFYYFGMLNQPI